MNFIGSLFGTAQKVPPVKKINPVSAYVNKSTQAQLNADAMGNPILDSIKARYPPLTYAPNLQQIVDDIKTNTLTDNELSTKYGTTLQMPVDTGDAASRNEVLQEIKKRIQTGGKRRRTRTAKKSKKSKRGSRRA